MSKAFVLLLLALCLWSVALVNLDWVVNSVWWWNGAKYGPHEITLWVGQDPWGREIRISAWHLYVLCVFCLHVALVLFFLLGWYLGRG